MSERVQLSQGDPSYCLQGAGSDVTKTTHSLWSLKDNSKWESSLGENNDIEVWV